MNYNPLSDYLQKQVQRGYLDESVAQMIASSFGIFSKTENARSETIATLPMPASAQPFRSGEIVIREPIGVDLLIEHFLRLSLRGQMDTDVAAMHIVACRRRESASPSRVFANMQRPKMLKYNGDVVKVSKTG